MHEPSDGIAEEVERQLQLALAAAAIAARRAIAARASRSSRPDATANRPPGPRKPGSTQSGVLATERLRPVFDDAWWRRAGPREIADMWQEANSWRDPDSRPREADDLRPRRPPDPAGTA